MTTQTAEGIGWRYCVRSASETGACRSQVNRSDGRIHPTPTAD